MASSARASLERWIQAGCTVALADGVGSPVGLYADLAEVARQVGGVRLIVGWSPEIAALDLTAFAEVRAFMPGFELRKPVQAGTVTYVPAWLSQIPALLASVWKPDVLLLAVRDGVDGLTLGSEASWIPSAARSAGVCLAEVNNELPASARASILSDVELIVLGETRRPPAEVMRREIDPLSARLGESLIPLVRSGGAIQFGPGPITEAFLAALNVPVRVESGILTDAVVDLDERGLLRGTPRGTYLSGSRRLYEWAHGRDLLDGFETTHDPARLASIGLLAINSALQIDEFGQVALDDADRGRVVGIGGHADYASGASRSADGLSVIVLPSQRGGRSTMVPRLTMPTSTPRSVVDHVVTEHGSVTVRGLSDEERAVALRPLFPAFVPADRKRSQELDSSSDSMTI